MKLDPQFLMFGRYLPVSELGSGGSADVSRVYDTWLRRDVALKWARETGKGLWAGDASASTRARFQREIRAMASLQVDGVPRILDCSGPNEPALYYTMELCVGPTLRELLETHRVVAPRQALNIAIDIGRTIIAVNAAGIIHRDIKPANIIVGPGTHARLIDFSCCVLLEDWYGTPRHHYQTSEERRFHTGPMMFCGTIPYSDPAIGLDGQVDVRADVFSLSVVIYEMLTGRRLHEQLLQGGGWPFRKVEVSEFPRALHGLAELLIRGTGDVMKRPTMAEFVRGLETVRAKLDGPLHRLRTPAAAFVAGAALTLLAWSQVVSPAPVAALTLRAMEERLAPMFPGARVIPEVPRSEDTLPAVKPSRRSRDAVYADIASPASASPAMPSVTTPTLQDVETRARACLREAGQTPEPIVVALLPGAAPDVRNAPAGAPASRCIGDAVRALSFVPSRGIQHTFFKDGT